MTAVYKAISAVQGALAEKGIAKTGKNVLQNYVFRGIDDVYNALAPILSKHGLCMLPRVLSRECVERVNSKGTALFYVTVEAEFDFVAAEDGSKHTIKTFGEAMDSGDKATNKAMSAAYKYAAIQTFAIPIEGEDADQATHEGIAPNREEYPEQRFQKNIAAWTELILSGKKTAEDVISIIESKNRLTDSQKEQIQLIAEGIS